MTVLVWLALACGGANHFAADASADLQVAEREDWHDRPPQDLPPVPEGVHIQSLSANRGGELSGYRVYHDGRYERSRLGGPWLTLPNLPSERLEEMKEAIGTAGLDSLPHNVTRGVAGEAALVAIVQVRTEPGGPRSPWWWSAPAGWRRSTRCS